MREFGPFRLHPERRLLTRDGVAVQLGGRALDILLYLSARDGQVVEKQRLIEAIWPGRLVEENNLTVQISNLRRLLGTTASGRSMIQTVSGRGYAFVSGREEGGAPLSIEPVEALVVRTRVEATTPHPTSSFVGRTAERAELIALLSANRLVTISAAGGMGKTRLAREVALELAPRFPDGVHVAELAGVDNPRRAIEQVATLFLLGVADRPTIERLTNAMRSRRMLLVLDNCEHLMEAVAELVSAVLEHCPDVTILATSREALGDSAERVFRLPPLSVPGSDPGGACLAVEAIRHDAVRLFVERATASVPGFVFDDRTAGPVAAICRHLDGIALAIEMAVPRLRVLSPGQLAERVHESLKLLAAPDRTAPPRHRTLRAMIDWSYALLSPPERRLLTRMVVFAGAVDLEAVQAVAGGDEANGAGFDTLEWLSGLVEKSLVVADTSTGPARYRLLATVRQYAREHMTPAEEAVLRRRHAGHYADVFAQAAAAWPTARTADWLPRAAADADELRAALAWSFGGGATLRWGCGSRGRAVRCGGSCRTCRCGRRGRGSIGRRRASGRIRRRWSRRGCGSGSPGGTCGRATRRTCPRRSGRWRRSV